MFANFDDFVSAFIKQVQSDYEGAKSIRNIKVIKGKKRNMLEYERIDKYPPTGRNMPPKTGIGYNVSITSNFKILEVSGLETGKCKECNTPENYSKSKRKYKKFLKTIVID